ncbi:MAG TPA: ATP-binding protein [Kofleriaceae bacterium]|nr:ATP-binding protein [Kofleriaceae bacterium]
MTRSGEPSALEQRFLILAPTGRDASLTCRMLGQAGLAAVACADLDGLISAAGEGAAALLIAEEALGRQPLARLGELLAGQETWSDLPIIVFTSGGGDQATIGARHAGLLPILGNVTLVDRPLRPITLISAARSALRARLRQYQGRAAIAEQERAVRYRDQFLAMLGHELRNPLAAIQLATQAADYRGESTRVQQVIRRQTAHLTRLVDDLLDVSRVTSGKLVLHRQVADLSELVERGLHTLEPELRTRKLDLVVDLPDEPVPVAIDVVRIEQVLTNLVTNAIKYTGAGGRIRVAISVDDDQAVLIVSDTGAGLAEDMLERIFELFAQADTTLERSRGGLGIGLTLVRSLLELHGGSIEARSPGLDQGSSFIARLPLAVQRAESAPARAVAGSAPRGGARILLVEDHEDSRELLTDVLQLHGHQVRQVADGRAGVDAALEEPPEVMIIDIGLPALDGYGVARQVRAELGERVYLIALTGYGQPDDRRRALDAGFDVHITKPVDSMALLDLLARHVSQRAPTSPPTWDAHYKTP